MFGKTSIGGFFNFLKFQILYYKKENKFLHLNPNGKIEHIDLDNLTYTTLELVPENYVECKDRFWKEAVNTFFREKDFEWEYNGNKYKTKTTCEDFKMKLNQHFYNNDYKKLPIKIFYKGKVWDFLGAVSDPGSGGALLERVVGGKTYSCIANIKNFKEIVNSN